MTNTEEVGPVAAATALAIALAVLGHPAWVVGGYGESDRAVVLDVVGWLGPIPETNVVPLAVMSVRDHLPVDTVLAVIIRRGPAPSPVRPRHLMN